MADETYNGWANYETWAANLWMDNDEGSQTYWREVAEEVWREAEGTQYMTRDRVAVHELADRIKGEHEDNVPDAVDGTVYADLLGGALSSVDWHEIAEHLIDAAREAIGDEDEEEDGEDA